jgi:hypothetical protein
MAYSFKWIMNTKTLPKWVSILILVVAIQIIMKWSVPTLRFWLTALGLHGFQNSLIGLVLHLLIFYETAYRFFIIRSVKPTRFEPTKLKDWPHVNLDGFAYYTDELQKLGFTLAGDYTSPTFKGILRLFIHPEFECFSEVVQFPGQQMFCTVFSSLEENWTMTVSNKENTAAACANNYVFLRLPRKINRFISKANPTTLLETFLDWRRQVSMELSIQPLKNVSSEMYFAQAQKLRRDISQRLCFSSFTWNAFESLVYRRLIKPPADWLGDYPKVKARLAKTT